MAAARRWVLALVLALSLSLGPPAGDQTQEDDPGWDCATMGNHQCG